MHRIISTDTDSDKGIAPLVQESEVTQQESEVTQQASEVIQKESEATQRKSEDDTKRPMIGLALSLLGLVGAISLFAVGVAKAKTGEDPITLSRLNYLGYGLLMASISVATVLAVRLDKVLTAKELQIKNDVAMRA